MNRLDIYIYIYIYICTHSHPCIYTYIYMYTRTHARTCLHTLFSHPSNRCGCCPLWTPRSASASGCKTPEPPSYVRSHNTDGGGNFVMGGVLRLEAKHSGCKTPQHPSYVRSHNEQALVCLRVNSMYICSYSYIYIVIYIYMIYI